MSEYYLDMAVCPWCGQDESYEAAAEPPMGERTIECRKCGGEYEIVARPAVEVEVEVPEEMEICDACMHFKAGDYCDYRTFREKGWIASPLENCPQGFGDAR